MRRLRRALLQSRPRRRTPRRRRAPLRSSRPPHPSVPRRVAGPDGARSRQDACASVGPRGRLTPDPAPGSARRCPAWGFQSWPSRLGRRAISGRKASGDGPSRFPLPAPGRGGSSWRHPRLRCRPSARAPQTGAPRPSPGAALTYTAAPDSSLPWRVPQALLLDARAPRATLASAPARFGAAAMAVMRTSAPAWRTGAGTPRPAASAPRACPAPRGGRP